MSKMIGLESKEFGGLYCLLHKKYYFISFFTSPLVLEDLEGWSEARSTPWHLNPRAPAKSHGKGCQVAGCLNKPGAISDIPVNAFCSG